MPFLSVIVPIYNADKYLNECLESILNQTYEDFELILVNDGSTDNSEGICESFAMSDGRIKLINKENGGLVSARKAGLANAVGEYIGWVDADDYVMPNMYEKMCTEAFNTEADIVICDIWSWNGNELLPLKQTMKGGTYNKEQLETDFYPNMLYSGKFYEFGILPSQVNKIMRKPIIDKNLNLVDDRIIEGEDLACTCFCILDAVSISYLKGQFLYKYRTNIDSMCHIWKDEKIESNAILLSYLYNRLKIYGFTVLLEQYWYYFACAYSNLVCEYANYLQYNKKKLDLLFDKNFYMEEELKANLFKLLNEKKIKIPYDRRVLIREVLEKQNPSHIKVKFILKVRFLLMQAINNANKEH